MKYILGKKQKMTQYFSEDGKAHPATLIDAGPVVVTRVKTDAVDGYDAIQFGYGEQKKERVSKPQLGQMGDKPFRLLREVEFTPMDKALGDSLDVTQFEKGDIVAVSGTSKGKGFQGVVKRHGFHGGRRSHGQKHSEREAGSIGATGPQRVFKGKRMPGRMGGDKITIKNLEVLDIVPEENKLIVKGAVPGRVGSIVEIVAK